MSTIIRRGVGAAEQSVLDRLTEALHQDLADVSRIIVEGKCKSYDEYRHKAGVISGLRKALEQIAEVRKKYQEE